MSMNIIMALLVASVHAADYTNEDSAYWNKIGTKQLEETLQRFQSNNYAKNIIIFIGDGMGISTITSARIYKGQKTGVGEGEKLSFETFPIVGLSKTYSVNIQVTDSAASGTALFTGVKTNNKMIGLNAKAVYNVCKTSDKDLKVDSIMKWAQLAGKDTGIVTKTRITHATPAACYAHTNNRNWECDSVIPPQYRDCVKDIARQLVEDEPGNKFKVILGGGGNQMGLKGLSGTIDDGCIRTDSKNLVQRWKNSKNNSVVVTTNKELMDIDINNTDYLMGIFSADHMYFAGEKWLKSQDQPSLVNMTIQAVNILNKNPNGFVLMIEGGLIDIGHHQNFAKLALEDTLEFEEAVSAAIDLTDKENTLIIVTADHSHTLTINGYPLRGNDILGFASSENVTYETLTYANGPGYKFHTMNITHWRNLTNSSVDMNDTYYRHFSPVYLSYETHGGEDVAVYAQGPSSHIFSGVYEENYIAHAISYAASIGLHAQLREDYNENPSQNLHVTLCTNSNDIKAQPSRAGSRSRLSHLSYIIMSVSYLFCKYN
ncbi:hypothetical protein L9F63_024002 [Diploptera punctata]|uniref:Alkaline phosphatase n=1 Tax=Diploptera punctata TaxID=6984 RepID=A0AAD7ZHY1_DIPPU|nr:hypothetical protein L9F63_024002 [Diploptera punctata]